MEMKQPWNFVYGTVTAIGSMPYQDAETALALVRRTLPEAPHWPQLPKRGRQESFIRQYLTPLVRLGLIDIQSGDSAVFTDDAPDWLEKVEKFYQYFLDFETGIPEEQDRVLAFFGFPPEAASGFHLFMQQDWQIDGRPPVFVKGHISGPLTVGLQVFARDQSAAFYREDLRDILTKTLALIAAYQVREMEKHGVPVVIFIDEPGLLTFGQSSYVSLSRQDISASLAQVVEGVTRSGGYAGAHCCSGVDWSILFQLPLQIVNFDAYGFFDSMLVYARDLETFLADGGCLSWGLVPTSDEVAREDVDSLQERFFQGVERLARQGVSKNRLLEQYMITPSCGAGTLSEAQTERVYTLARELQEALQKAVS